MKVGYARTSTVEQEAGFAAQLRDLETMGCEKVFSEQVSSVAERKQLSNALTFVRAGDTFIVTKLDRLARSTKNLIEINEILEGKNVSLQILDMSLDTSTPQGKLMMTVCGAFAQFEREIMRERQLEGIARARKLNKYKGRKIQYDRKEFKRLIDEGKSSSDVCDTLGMSKAHFWRLKAQHKNGEL